MFSGFMNSGNFWGGFRSGLNNGIDDVLNSNHCTLEKLLDESELIQELKYSNRELIDFMDHEEIMKLIDYIVIMPEKDEHDRGHKYPFTAAEVLGSECNEILDKFFEAPLSEELRDRIAEEEFRKRQKMDDDLTKRAN